MKASASETALTFDWPRREGFSFVLFACVFASLAVHAATFFVFRVVNPSRASIVPTAPRVSLLTPSSAENIALLHWVDAEDPALIASANTFPPLGMAEIAYRPSFETSRTQPLGAPAEIPEPIRFPPAKDFLSVMAAATSTPAAATPDLHPTATAIHFSSPLAGRIVKNAIPFQFSGQSAASLDAARWLVGVNDRGEVRYTFLQHSSGDPAFDTAAAAHLRRLHFQPASEPIAWSFATIEWGDDAYQPRDPKPE